MAKKNSSTIRRVNNIDESELLASMGESTNKKPNVEITISPNPSSAQKDFEEEENENTEEDQVISLKETSTVRKASNDFKSVFLNPRVLKVRQSVYISQEIHGKISKIVNQIADAELTVGTYVDTILRQHLKKNKNEINALYKQKRDDLIE